MKRPYAIRIRKHNCADVPAMPDSDGECSREHSLASQFIQACQKNARQVAIADNGNDLDYAWLLKQANLVATRLIHCPDFESGIHVGLRLKNSPEYLVAFYGVLIAGGVVVPVPMHHKEQQLLRLCDLASLSLIIEDAVIPADDRGQTIELNSTDDEQPKLLPVTHGQLAMMLFTSGSSGAPKAVMLSHRNILANCSSILECLPIDTTDRTLAIMPFAHALGNSVLQTHILSGATLVFADQLIFPSAMLNALEQHNCTSLAAVPEVMQSLLLVMRDQQPASTRLKYLAVAGGKFEVASAKELATKIAPADLFLMYGQTEATARLAFLPAAELMEHAETVGHAIPGVEFCIRDDFGKAIKDGEIGTLHASGDNIMLGYYNDPKATADVLIDGWLNTGDLAKVTVGGQIKICGRVSGLIKTQGYRFHPIEVENMLADQLPELQLIATPVNFYGATRLALFAKQQTEKSTTVEHIQTVCRDALPRHMLPQRIEFVKRWPLSGSRKIDRRALQAELESRLSMTDESQVNNTDLLCGEYATNE